MERINIDDVLLRMKFKSVSRAVSKKFVLNTNHWLDGQQIHLPMVRDMLAKDVYEIYRHSQISIEDFEKIRLELYIHGLHFGMLRSELVHNQKEFVKEYPVDKYPHLIMTYLRYTEDEDVVKALSYYESTYKGCIKSPLVEFCNDWSKTGIRDVHEFAQRVINEGKVLNL